MYADSSRGRSLNMAVTRDSAGADLDSGSASQGGASTPVRRFRGAFGLVALCVLFTLALRVPFIDQPLLPDEAGMLLIASEWEEGPYLYGDRIVGRGIVAMLFYALADLLGGALALRLLACLVAVTLVVAGGWAGHQLAGRSGAGWAALVAAAYSSSYAHNSEGMNERLLAAAFVMVSCACALAAVRTMSPVARYGLALVAGTTATCAVLVVQSYVEAIAFAGILVVGAWRVGALSGRTTARLATAGFAGFLVPVGILAIAVQTTWITWHQVWFQMLGFRLEVTHVFGSSDSDRPSERMYVLIAIAVLTGMVALVWFLLQGVLGIRRQPMKLVVWLAVLVMLAVSLAAMMMGGDWWRDYLQQPIPALAVGAALVAPRHTAAGRGARIAAAVAAVTAVAAVYLGLERPVLGTPSNEGAVGSWVAAEARPGDTVLVAWGKPNVVYEAGMTSPYRHLWSLSTRTLDPDLDELLATLRGPDAPTWIVEWHDLDSWGLDENGEFAAVLNDRYMYVGAPCGIDVFLLRSEARPLPPASECGPVRGH